MSEERLDYDGLGYYTGYVKDLVNKKNNEISDELTKAKKSYEPITKNLCSAIEGGTTLTTANQLITAMYLDSGDYTLSFSCGSSIKSQYTIESVEYDMSPNGKLSSGGGLMDVVQGTNVRKFHLSGFSFIAIRATEETEVYNMQIETGDTASEYEEYVKSLRTLTTDVTLLQNENKDTSAEISELEKNMQNMNTELSKDIQGIKMIYNKGTTEYGITAAGSYTGNVEIATDHFTLKCINGETSGEIRFTKPIDFRESSRLLFHVSSYNGGTMNILRAYIGTSAGSNDLMSYDLPFASGEIYLPDNIKTKSEAYLTFIIGVSSGNTGNIQINQVCLDSLYQDYFNKSNKLEDFYFMKYYGYLQNNLGKLFAKSTTVNDKIESNGRSFTRTVNDPALFVKFKHENSSGSYSNGYAILSTTKRGCSVGTPGDAYGALANDIYTETTPNGNTVYVSYMGSSWANVDRSCVATTGDTSTTITEVVYYRNDSVTKNKDKYNKFILTVADYLLFDGQDDLNISSSISSESTNEQTIKGKLTVKDLEINGYTIKDGTNAPVSKTIVVNKSDGVTEVGHYLDFHVDPSAEKDNDVRLTADSAGLNLYSGKRFNTTYTTGSGYARMLTDGEGGTIELAEPDGKYAYHIDTCNKTQLRLYAFDRSPWKLTSTWLFDRGGNFITPSLKCNGVAQIIGNISLGSEKLFNIKDHEEYGLKFTYFTNPQLQILPTKDNITNLGHASYRFAEFRCNNIYISSGTAVTSDARYKDDIKPLDDKTIFDFVMSLTPSSYKYKDGESGRTHFGLIAQDVEKVVNNIGLTTKDFGGIVIENLTEEVEQEVIDESGETVIEKHLEETGEVKYNLRYEEFIAPLIKTVQIQQKTIESLTQRIAALEANNS